MENPTPEAFGHSARYLEQRLLEVRRFYHEVLGAELPDEPRELSEERYAFKLGHLREELDELERGRWRGDLEEQADALIDISYVALGALLEMGLAPGAAFTEVHEANMRRVRGPSHRGYGTFDAFKPDGWQGPRLIDILELTKADIDWLIEQKHNSSQGYEADDFPVMKAEATFTPKILVIGHARHGKDTAAEMLRDEYGLRFTSSSLFCAERVVLPWFNRNGRFYPNAQICFEDRGDHRETWYRLIEEFNTPDKTALARAILEENDVYVGLRSHREFHACRNAGLFDAIIWVDASERVGPEGAGSMTLEPWMADFVLDNNGPDAEAMRPRLRVIMERVLNGDRA